LTATLESLKQQGIVACHTIETVSKPAEVWSLIQPLRSAEPTRANEQYEQSPWQVAALEDSSESSYARDGSIIDQGCDSGIQVEFF
jgi:hypothetical protein